MGCGGRTGRSHTRKGGSMIPADTQPHRAAPQEDLIDPLRSTTDAGGKQRAQPAFWREALAPYARAHSGRALLGLATSVLPYLALSVAMYLALSISYLLVLAIAVPTAVFLVRT